MSTLEGQVAFITGAGRGQGRSHAEALAERGVDIIAVDLCEDIDTVSYPLATPSDLDETAAAVKAHGRRVVTYQADVRDMRGLSRALNAGLSEFDRLDIVLANAGIAPSFGLDIEPADSWGNIIDVNLTGVWNTVWVTKQAIIDGKRGGSIVITSSTAGLKGLADGSPGADAYVASKHGLVGLTKATALEAARDGITCNALCPGFIHTNIVDRQIDDQTRLSGWTRERIMDELILSKHPTKEFVRVEDVAAFALFLCSDAGSAVTGTALSIDGGWVAT